MKVAVLGCGPAGLIAAHAARKQGADVAIFSKKQKSEMPGAQYLHERIPDVSPYEPHGYLTYAKVGTAEGYAEKVYGDAEHPVSWDTFTEGVYPAWSIVDTYDKLWRRWVGDVVNMDLTNRRNRNEVVSSFDLVLSTVPAPVLCRGDNGCKFDGQRVFFVNRPALGCPEDTIIYNGDVNTPWYRTSQIFGHASTEYTDPAKANANHAGVSVVGFKPTRTTCQCPPDHVVRLGRFGKWDKAVLVHHAYQEACDAVLALQ